MNSAFEDIMLCLQSCVLLTHDAALLAALGLQATLVYTWPWQKDEFQMRANGLKSYILLIIGTKSPLQDLKQVPEFRV